VLLPFALILFLAGGATFLYALTLFLPLIDLLTELSIR